MKKINNYLSSLWLTTLGISFFCFILLSIAWGILIRHFFGITNEQRNSYLYIVLNLIYWIFYFNIIFDIANNLFLSIRKTKSKTPVKILRFYYDWSSNQYVSKKYWIIYLIISKWIWTISIITFNCLFIIFISLHFYQYLPISITSLIFIFIITCLILYSFIFNYVLVNFKKII